MIYIKNLNFSFGNRHVLSDINMSISAGECIGIIGANGSGKTTLLKCIAGIYRTQNCITIDKQPLESFSIKSRAKKIAVLHQHDTHMLNLNGRDVVSLGRYSYMQPFSNLSSNDNHIVDQAMATTTTTAYATRNIDQLSGGERQRVRFAKTLAQQSRYLLLDEATAALDIKHENELFSMAKQLATSGNAVVMTIHNIRMAIKYCPRIILLSQGRIIADGSAEQVITAQNLQEAYQINAQVYLNTHTGNIDFEIERHN